MRRAILASREELTALRDKVVRKPFDAMHEHLRNRCSLILESAPVSEGQWQSMWQQGLGGSAVNAARTVHARIFDLLVAHHIDRNVAFRDRAVEELKSLIAWSTWVDPSHGDIPADLCTAEAAVAATVALDWLWEDLHEADRIRILQAIRHKAIEPYREGIRRKVFWCDCYHSWNAIVNAGCGLAALALGDDEPFAQETYNLAITALGHFFSALGREGGWDEGLTCWGHALRHVLVLGEACARLLDDRRIVHARGMDATGLFPVYFTPNGLVSSFGDISFMPLYGSLYLLVKHHGLKELAWWLDNYAFKHDVSSTGWASVGSALLFRPMDAESPRVPDLSPLKVFHEIGWAAISDHWPHPSLYVSAKTGDLSAHHSQRDMNSIQVQVNGEMLIFDPGRLPPGAGGADQDGEDFYNVQARAHNTIVIADRDHALDAQGDIVEAQCAKQYRWLACDAGTACGEAVQFVRHLVMIVNQASSAASAVVVLDEVHSNAGEKLDLYWHAKGRVELAAKGAGGIITGSKEALHFLIISTVKSSLRLLKAGDSPAETHQVLNLSAGLVDTAYLLTVFSTQKIGKAELKKTGVHDLRVRLPDAELHFKLNRKHLQLDRVAPR